MRESVSVYAYQHLGSVSMTRPQLGAVTRVDGRGGGSLGKAEWRGANEGVGGEGACESDYDYPLCRLTSLRAMYSTCSVGEYSSSRKCRNSISRR